MAGGVEAPEPGDGSEKTARRTRGRVIPSRRRPSLSCWNKAGYSLRRLNSTLYLDCALHRRQHRKRTNSFYHALCWCLLLTGSSPGGGQPCFSLYFLLSESSLFLLTGRSTGRGRTVLFSSSSLVPSPRRKHYRKEANCVSLQLYSESVREGPTRSFCGSLSPRQRQCTWT